MGKIDHEIAIVITWCDDTNLDLFKAIVKDINDEWHMNYTECRDLVTESGPHCNGFVQYTFNICGSKTSWKEWDRAKELRDRFFRAAHLLLVIDRCVLVELPEEGPMKVREH